MQITDEPYEIDYKIETIIPMKLNLGFKEPHLIDFYIKRIHEGLVSSSEVSNQSAFKSFSEFNI